MPVYCWHEEDVPLAVESGSFHTQSKSRICRLREPEEISEGRMCFNRWKLVGIESPLMRAFPGLKLSTINGVSIHFWANSNACARLHWILLLRVTIWIHLHYQNCMCTIQIYYAAILDSCNNVSQWGYWSKSLMQNGTLAWKFSQLTWPWVKLTCRFYVRRRRWHEMTS